MYIGETIGETKKLLLNSVSSPSLKYPCLIIGYELACTLYSDIQDFKITDNIYWCYSIDESPEQYEICLDKFIEICFEQLFQEVQINQQVCLQPQSYTQDLFIDTTNLNTVVTQGNNITVFNTSISNFCDNQFEKSLDTLITLNSVWSTNCNTRLDALLKANLVNVTIKQIRKFFQVHDKEHYLGYWALQLINQLDKTGYKTWARAFYVQEWLNTANIYIDTECALDNEIVNTIIEQSKKGVLKQKYNGTDKVTGRIFTKNSKTNVQGLTTTNKKVLKAKNGQLLEFDYKYFELKLLSQICGFELGEDPHQTTADLIGVSRSIGKSINYAIIYEKDINKVLAEHNALQHAHKLKELLIDKMSGLKNQLTMEYKTHGYITNVFDRKIVPNKDYALLNNFIQSTAADFINAKLFTLFLFLKKYKSEICFQNHDSIIFNIVDSEHEQIICLLNEILHKPQKSLVASGEFKLYN